MKRGTISILSAGALTGVGLSAEQTAFGVRAGLFTPRTIAFRDAADEPIGAVLVPSIAEEIEGWERLVWLALPALREARAAASLVPSSGEVAPLTRLFLALPTARPGFDEADQARVVREVADAAFDGDAHRITSVVGDREAFASALALATAHLAANPNERVLCGAVDSFHSTATYRALDADHRVLSERSPDGFIPGEGAAFVVLGGERHPDALAELTSVELRAEPSDDDVLAEAWTDAVRAAIDGVRHGFAGAEGRGAEPLWVLLDQRTERHRGAAWRNVAIRLHDVLGGKAIGRGAEIDALAERLGDPGAASGAILAVWAAIGLASGFSESGQAIVALAGEGAGRACFGVVRAGEWAS